MTEGKDTREMKLFDGTLAECKTQADADGLEIYDQEHQITGSIGGVAMHSSKITCHWLRDKLTKKHSGMIHITRDGWCYLYDGK